VGPPLTRDQAWWDRYNEYLASPAWREKRAAVLRRDKHTCQACLKVHATEVHHKTYEHVFDEPLFDLVAICKSCHDRITAASRARRAPFRG